jgi:capsular exopolysaccharide synthesis family protein
MTQGRDERDLAAPGAPARNLWLALWRRKGLILLGTVVGVVLAGLVFTQYPPVYLSTAQLLMVSKRSSTPLTLAEGGDAHVAYMEDYVSSQLTTIKSPEIIERAVKKRNLGSLPSLQGKGDPVGVIKANLAAEREKDSSGSSNNIINLSYRGPAPEDCAVVLSAIIEAYTDFLDEAYQSTSDKTVKLIKDFRDDLHKNVEDKKKAYAEFRQKSPLIWKGKDGINVEQERVAGIEAGRSKLMMRQAELQQRLKAVEDAVKENRPRAVVLALAAEPKAEKGEKADAPPGGHPLEDQLVLLMLQEKQLLEDYGDDHPQVISVRKRIDFLRDLLKRAPASRDQVLLPGEGGAEEEDPVKVCVDGMKRQLLQAEMELHSLDQLLAAEQKAARSLADYEIQDEEYRDQIKPLEQARDAAINRLAAIDKAREGGGLQAHALAKPAAGVKVEPNFPYFLAAGLLLGTLAGVGLAYLAELTDKGFRTAEEIRRRLGLPVIGHIPLLAADEAAKASADEGLTTLDPFLCVHYRPKSVESEAYRAVRTALYFSTQGGGHNLIQITSPDMGDGKSTLATNLAVSIAQSGKKTILIDADLRRPRLHKMMGLPANLTGLAAVISGQAELSAAVQQTAVPGLSVLPCGPLPPNPAELLTSPRLKEVLDALRAEYDFVLVDTPPLLAVTDPCAVAPRVDGVILTLRMSKRSRPKAERAREILATLGVKVVGVVVNGVSRQGGAGRYGGEQYEYSYGPSDYNAAEEGEATGGYYDEPGGGSAPAAGEDGAKAEPPAAPPPPAGPVAARPARAGRQGFRGLRALAWLFAWWA